MDVVYFFRPVAPDSPRSATEEMRYSLRSLASNLASLDEVHVFGGRAPWFSPHVHHYPVRQGAHKHANTWKIWRQIADAARTGYLPEWFLIMNDDYFLMRPWAGDVPAYHAGPMTEWIAARRDHQHIREAATRTAAWVAAQGVPLDEQLSYELHVPLLVHGPALAAIWPALDRAAKGNTTLSTRMIKRSPVGNLSGFNATAVPMAGDVKVIRDGDPMPDAPWVSTSDLAFASRNTHRTIGVDIRSTFKRPSRFETGHPPIPGRPVPGAARLVRP